MLPGLICDGRYDCSDEWDEEEHECGGSEGGHSLFLDSMCILGKLVLGLMLGKVSNSFCRTNIFQGPTFDHTSYLSQPSNRLLCKQIQSSVKISNGYVKETALILHKLCSFTKSV